MSEHYGRRQVLAASTGVAGTAALAACSSGTQSQPGSDGTQTTPQSPPPTGQSLVALSEIPVGQAKSVTMGDRELIVARPESSSAVAFSAVCTHQGCTVTPAESELRCPCHGSTYETLTGKVTSGPADAPLEEVPVNVRDGQVTTA